MRSLGTRRAVLATGVATVAAVALAACSAGQVAETALKRPSNAGVNVDNADRSVFIRNLSVQYPGVEGYAAGEDAPLEVGIFNQTREPITVLVSSQPYSGATESQGIVSARQIGLVGGGAATPSAPGSAIPEPSGSRPSGTEDDQNSDQLPSPDASTNPSPGESASPAATPSEAAVRPARIEIGPLGSATFLPGDAEQLTAVGLTGKLMPGNSINLVFEFSNGAAPLTVQAPVSVPQSPASRAPGNPNENMGGEHE
ncbi:hypothetical protein [Actinoplanes sp. NPDC049316]|uniref:hypothetical protein n=1 Tax=Actinoplanes sp. NPDC049316 TaxID=3154727 RepID=UPI00343D16B0